MILAKFVWGPAHDQILSLPQDEPTERFVIPQFDPITLEFFYLLAGFSEPFYFYLYDEDYRVL